MIQDRRAVNGEPLSQVVEGDAFGVRSDQFLDPVRGQSSLSLSEL
jgi:hypothetical protein